MTKDIEAWPLELTSFDSVRKFADRVELEDVPINALICNAAVATGTYAKTQDGWETTFVPKHGCIILCVDASLHLLDCK